MLIPGIIPVSTHIIHSQKVFLHTTLSANAFESQSRISNLFRNDLSRKLESLFDEISGSGETVRIEKLSLDLGNISDSNLEQDFSEKLISSLRQIVNNKKNGEAESAIIEGFSIVEKKQSSFEGLLYFLDHGYLPWYVTVKEIDAWEYEMFESFLQKDWERVVMNLKNRAEPNITLKRLSCQFSDLFLENILRFLLPSLGQRWQMLYNDLLKAGFQKQLIWQNALKAAMLTNGAKVQGRSIENLASNEIPAQNTAIENFMNTVLSAFQDDVTSPKNEVTKRFDELPEKMEEALFVSNAGLIILHPFLPMYFEELGFTENNRFKNESLQHRAVLLLQYIVTNKSRASEMHLLLPKLLCNMNFEDPVENQIDLTESEIQESRQLLISVIKHWTPLNRTSINGLQETFLQREGRLSRTENGWLLQVEQKTVDILLNKLPWGIGIIKLPWMTDFLSVDWTY